MSPYSPTVPLEEGHQLLLELCDTLEAIADGLPHTNAHLCIAAADALEPLVERLQVLEEAVLFPVLAASGRPERQRTVARLRRQHRSHMATAGEVSDALRGAVVAGSAASSPDAMGHLLRGFFDSLRRHVYGELELIQQVLPGPGDRTS